MYRHPDVGNLTAFLSGASYADMGVSQGTPDSKYVKGPWAIPELRVKTDPLRNGTVTITTYGLSVKANCSNPVTQALTAGGTSGSWTLSATSVNGCAHTTTFTRGVSAWLVCAIEPFSTSFCVVLSLPVWRGSHIMSWPWRHCGPTSWLPSCSLLVLPHLFFSVTSIWPFPQAVTGPCWLRESGGKGGFLRTQTRWRWTDRLLRREHWRHHQRRGWIGYCPFQRCP